MPLASASDGRAVAHGTGGGRHQGGHRQWRDGAKVRSMAATPAGQNTAPDRHPRSTRDGQPHRALQSNNRGTHAGRRERDGR